MRICIVTIAGHGVGGMQDHTRALAKGLVVAGHDVEVITTRHPEGVREEERDGARWHYVDAAPARSRLPTRDPAWLPHSLDTYLRLQRNAAFDVVHSESTSAIQLVRRGFNRTVPIVVKFHGSGIAHTRAHLRRFRSGDARTAAREAKGLVWLLGRWFQYGQLYRFRSCVWMVPSEREFDDTRRSHLLRRDLGYVVPNGIDTSVFKPRSPDEARVELGLSHSPLFVCAGRLDRAKGTHHAIRALRQLADRGRAATLAVIGTGPAREELESLARKLGLASQVVFTGPQPHDVLASYLAAADAFVFPTELNEAAPLVPLQALACGTPVIASSVGSLPELLAPAGQTGILVRPGEPEALVEALASVLADANLRQRLRANGLARIHAEYTLERMVERTLAVYEIARERQAGAQTR